MSGNNQLTTLLSGTASTTTGISMLPNTHGNLLLITMSTLLILAGVVILGSFVLMKIMRKISDK